MSGVLRRTTAARLALHCDSRGCADTFVSAAVDGDIALEAQWRGGSYLLAPAWDLGWRVYMGARSQMTYCWAHGPSRPMRLLHGRAD